MSSKSTPQSDMSQPPYRRLKLLVSTPEHQRNSSGLVQPVDNPIKAESSRSSSPARPSYSPVTPTLSHSSIAGQDLPGAEWIDEPPPLPVSLDENPDAIALQATLSLLQMQRQQSLRDIRGLNRIRQEALEDPQAFVEDLRSGKLSKPAPQGILFTSDTEDSDEEEKTSNQNQSQFGKLPASQSIARCPPIEWSKYRVAGDSLEQLHEQQRRFPGITEGALDQGFQPQPHEIAAPYRPFTDRLEPLPPSNDSRNYDR